VSDGVTSVGEAPTPFKYWIPRRLYRWNDTLNFAGRQSINRVIGIVSINPPGGRNIPQSTVACRIIFRLFSAGASAMMRRWTFPAVTKFPAQSSKY
jgi:hypothetical protein